MLRHDADVAVVGAGSAGVAAAVAAAETGASTLLLEASGAVGGTLAWQLLEHSAGFHDGGGCPVVGGFGQRLVDALRSWGASPGHIPDDVGYTATRTPVNHAELPLVEATMLADAGADLWLHAQVVGVLREGKRVAALEAETPAGRVAVGARVVIDCSGDAVVSDLAGAQAHSDGTGGRQPASLLFKLGNVDFVMLLRYARENLDDLRRGSRVGEDGDRFVNLWGFGRLLAAGHASGQLGLRRSEMHLAGWPARREAIVNVSRVAAGDPDSNWRGAAYMQLSRQVLELVRWFRAAVPGCADAYLAGAATRVGVRESRRVVGRFTLRAEDLLSGRRFDDAIAQGAFPIDVHDGRRPSLSLARQLGSSFDIPYRCLCPRGLDNLLVAGRCVSSTQEANGSIRITATCFATGEAAGVAAALAAQSGKPVAEVKVGELRSVLRGRGALLHPARPTVSGPRTS